MNNINGNNFKFKITEWRGYVVRALEDIDKDIDEIKTKLDNLNKRINYLQIKVATIGASVAVLISLLFKFLIKQ